MKVNSRSGLVLAALVWFGTPALAEDNEGSDIYGGYCLTCHQAGGGGVPFMQPSLRDSARVMGEIDELIDFVLRGTINRGPDWQSDYNNAMPAFDYLSDADLASVLSYIREEFGKGASAISTSDIERVRAP